MSTGTSIEQRLKSQMDRVQVRLRPEAAREAYRAHRRHLVRSRSAAAVATAAVLALAAILTATGAIPLAAPPGGQPPSQVSNLPAGGGIPPASLQPAPPGDGLTVPQAAQDILWIHATITRSPASDSTVSNTFETADMNRMILYTPAGAPALDTASRHFEYYGAPADTVTTVSYQERAWSRDSMVASGRGPGVENNCQLVRPDGIAAVSFIPHPDAVRSIMGCPGLTVTRGLVIDGVSAIKITGWSVTMWVNASSYLPIQATMTSANPGPIYQGIGGLVPVEGRFVSQTVQYGFLPPTAANRAYLTAVTPHGFKGSTSQPGIAQPGSSVPAQPWTPPAGAIAPFGLSPVPAGNGLTAAAAKADILWVRSTTEANPASDTLLDNIFNYKSASSDLTYYPDGQPWDEDSEATFYASNGKLTSTHTVVNWQAKTYSVDYPLGGGAPVPVTQASCRTGLNLDFQHTPDAARALLGCANLTVKRGQAIDGIDAITITQGATTLWINAATCLPIQETVTNPKGHYPPAGYHSAPSPGQVYQYTYLPPTQANLAYLAAPVPPGFRHAS
jgi:hypothetical protein